MSTSDKSATRATTLVQARVLPLRKLGLETFTSTNQVGLQSFWSYKLYYKVSPLVDGDSTSRLKLQPITKRTLEYILHVSKAKNEKNILFIKNVLKRFCIFQMFNYSNFVFWSAIDPYQRSAEGCVSFRCLRLSSRRQPLATNLVQGDSVNEW